MFHAYGTHLRNFWVQKKRRPIHYPVQACDSLNILMERLRDKAHTPRILICS